MTEETDRSRSFELKDMVMAALTALSIGGVTGSAVGGGGSVQSAQMAKQIAVLSTQMEAQSKMAAERDDAQAGRIAELVSTMSALETMFRDRTEDRYPRSQAVSDFATVHGSMAEVRAEVRAHVNLPGHPQTQAMLEDVRRRLALLEADLKELAKKQEARK